MAKNKLLSLLKKITDAEDKVVIAKSKRDAFLEPILTVLGATGGGIDSVHLSEYNEQGQPTLFDVTRVGSTRGCSWADDYSFPATIFTSADPIAAAKQYVAALAQRKADAEKAEKMAQFEKLQQELGL